MYLVEYDPQTYKVYAYHDLSSGVYTDNKSNEFFVIDEETYMKHMYEEAWANDGFITNEPPPNAYSKLTKKGWITDEATKQRVIKTSREEAKAAIDNAVSAIYARYNPFVLEYQLRKEQADAFIEANYKGDVPSQIKAVADSSGLTPKEAADSIIADAVKLTTALEKLAELRMKKLAVDGMNEVDVINAHRDAVLAEIKAVDDSL